MHEETTPEINKIIEYMWETSHIPIKVKSTKIIGTAQKMIRVFSIILLIFVKFSEKNSSSVCDIKISVKNLQQMCVADNLSHLFPKNV